MDYTILGVKFSRVGKLFFQFQQLLFHFQSPGIAGKRTVTPHHPVAGDQDGQGIIPVGQSHRPGSAGTANALCQRAVALGLPVGDLQEGLPDFALKVRTHGRQRQVKNLPLAVEIFQERSILELCTATSGKIFA